MVVLFFSAVIVQTPYFEGGNTWATSSPRELLTIYLIGVRVWTKGSIETQQGTYCCCCSVATLRSMLSLTHHTHVHKCCCQRQFSGTEMDNIRVSLFSCIPQPIPGQRGFLAEVLTAKNWHKSVVHDIEPEISQVTQYVFTCHVNVSTILT